MTKRFQWRRFFFGIRTRIVTWYVVLMACSTGISILAVRQVLSLLLEERGKKVLAQELREFRQLVQTCDDSCKTPDLFDRFLAQNIPDDGEFLLAIVDGKLYKSSPLALPQIFRKDANYLKNWGKLNQQKQGQIFTLDEQLRYLAEPIIIAGKPQGVLVIIHSTAGDLRKINEVTAVMLQVTFFVLVIASVITWGVAGKLLQPLQILLARGEGFVRQIFGNKNSSSGRQLATHGDEITEFTSHFNEMLNRIGAAFISQRNFINDAGHELRTPITIIRGHLELLEQDNPQEMRETLAIVTDELDRMSRMVNELLLLAKAERPDFLHVETVDIATFMEELFIKLKALGDRNWNLDSKAWGQIVADRQRLTQALINLAQNAVQHTAEYDKITLGSKLLDNQIHFWIQDTGEGIELADQQRIFDRFARAAKSRRRSEGYGLGLAIVKAIATSHGGKVELQSYPLKGSTFSIVLPLEPPNS
jgi:signal transduction histidine kinase